MCVLCVAVCVGIVGVVVVVDNIINDNVVDVGVNDLIFR